MIKNLIYVLGIAILLVSCEKKEEPVNPAKSQALTAGMGSTYENMLYFNVSTGIFVQEGSHYPYDLQFPNGPADQHIFLNSSNYMFVKNMGVVSFESVQDTIGGSEWMYDYPNGEPNRTAFGDWMDENGDSKGEVFIVDRGFNADGFKIGYKKIQVLSANGDGFTLRCADLDNTADTTVYIEKNLDNERIQFSFNTMGIEPIEPISTLWHLHFTQYTDYDLTDQGDTVPYSVRGVLINQSTTSVAIIENADFNDLTLQDVTGLSYSSHLNVIGYDWKVFSLDNGIYEVDPKKVYVIREIGGNYYKMRFVDYYNDMGEKGYAKFEIIGL